MNATTTRPARGLGAYPAHHDDPSTIAIGTAQAPASSRLTKIAVLAVFAAVAALGAEGTWLLSHHDTAHSITAPIAHEVTTAPGPIAPAASPPAPTIISPANGTPEYANGSNDASTASAPSTGTTEDAGTPPASALIDPAAPVPAQPAPVINVVVPLLPTASGATGSGTADPGAGSSGSAGSGSGGSSGSGSGSGSTPNSKSPGIGTSHVNDQEKQRGPALSGTPQPGTTGSFGNTAANPGGSGAPVPGATKFPSAAQRLFP